MAASYFPRDPGLLPMLMTVASGRSNAVEWYSREYVAAPPELNVPVSGSYRSAVLPGVFGVSLFTEPPSASTLPLGRMTAFIWMRPVDMLGPGVQLGEVKDRSMISVELVAGLPPPKAMTFGL